MKATDRETVEGNVPVALLCLAILASAVLLLTFSAGLTFFQDTWDFLMNRRGFTADAFLQPHNEHIVVIPVGIEQVLLRLFGMSSTTPEFVALTGSLLATAVLTFVYVRRRLGPWPAVIGALLLLFVGPAWQDLLWPFQIGFVGSVLFGVAMLLALDRDDQRSDVAACLSLAISIGFSSLGLAFAVGAGVDVLQKWRDRGLRRAYVAVAPVLLYAAWWLGWGHAAESHLTLDNVLTSPVYALEGLAGSVGSLLGLSTTTGAAVDPPRWGYVLLAAFVGLLLYRQVRKPGFPAGLWPVVGSTATFWLLAGCSYVPGREAYSSRYIYAGAVFVLLLAANLLHGVRPGRRALLVAGTLALAAVASNLTPLREGRDWLKGQTVLTRADLAAIEIARRTVDPSFYLAPEIAGTPTLINVGADNYLAAVRKYGSPAYTPAELANAPEAGRLQADIVLANALPVTIEIKKRAAHAAGGCIGIPGSSGSDRPPLPLRPGITEIELAAGRPGTIRLRRFAISEYPLQTEGVPGGSTTLLDITGDGIAKPWYIQIEAAQAATVCRSRD
jgi:hypothetical protein